MHARNYIINLFRWHLFRTSICLVCEMVFFFDIFFLSDALLKIANLEFRNRNANVWSAIVARHFFFGSIKGLFVMIVRRNDDDFFCVQSIGSNERLLHLVMAH